VYSVCTITREECEDVVNYAEGKLELELQDQSPFLAGTGFDPYHQAQRFNPDTHETGYFIARFTRN